MIGNPPYVQLQKLKETSTQLEKANFQTFEKTGDLYVLFYERSCQILKNNGLLGFITSNKWLRANYGKKLRSYLTANTKTLLLMDLGAGIFDSATVDSNILIYEKATENQPFKAISLKEKRYDFENIEHLFVEINPQNDEIWTISSHLEQNIKQKIEHKGKMLKDWDIQISYGIKTGFNDAFIIDEQTKNQLVAKDAKNNDLIVPILRGRDIGRYNIDYQNLYLINVHNGYGDNPRIKIEDYPAVKEFLDQYYPQLAKRSDKGATPYNLRNCAYIDDFYGENIFYPDICQRLSFVVAKNTFATNTGYYLKTDNKYLLSILNSNLINYYYKTISAQLGNGGMRCFTIYIQNLPIPEIPLSEQQPFIAKAEQMLSLNQALQETVDKFLRTLNRKFDLSDFSKNLQSWYLLSYKDFVKELAKKKVKLSLGDEAEWEDYFLAEQAKAQSLQNQIAQTDDEINQMVYALYGLSDDEIKIIE